MRTEDFHYDLPEELIAQTPLEPRDSSRMLVCHRDTKALEHRIFRDLPSYLDKGDVLVLNETRVLPARLIGQKIPTGGAMEMLLLRRIALDQWEVLVKPGRRAVEGALFSFGDGAIRATILSRTETGGRIVSFQYDGVFETLLEQLGRMPLPPYIHAQLEDQTRYQTVYAVHDGSAAAPTAGLHFTPELLEKLRGQGVILAPIVLHVGLGTFRPVKARDIDEHVMHSEYYEVSQATAASINRARAAGGRIFCIGTTSVRTLETAAGPDGLIRPGQGWTDIFIKPGYRFRAVDGLLTNFHLPESTLLMLVSAFWDRDATLEAYRRAVEARYRFFSFGDCMLIV